MNGKKWEQYRHWQAIDWMYWVWTAKSLIEIEDTQKQNVALKEKWKPRDYLDVILESYKNVLQYKREYNVILPKSCEQDIKKARKILDSITRDDKYRIEEQ
jgi:hypothetical protein